MDAGKDTEAHDGGRDHLPTPPTDQHAGGPSGSNLGGETERLPNTYNEERMFGLILDNKIHGMNELLRR